MIAGMGAAMWVSVVDESQTWDEATHLAAGFSYWKTGDFRLNQEHPPLSKLLCAIPLLLLDPAFARDSDAWKQNDQVAIAVRFLYENRVDADLMLLAGRSVTIVLTLALALVLAVWTRRRFGAPAALIALFLLVTDPNMIAHGRYVTSDAHLTLFLFLSVICWLEYLEKPGRWKFIAAVVALGAALGAKFSSLFLLGILPLLVGFRWIFERWGRERLPRAGLWHLLRVSVALPLCALLILSLFYAPATWRALRKRLPPLTSEVWPNTDTGRFVHSLGEKYNLPAHPLLTGLYRLANHNEIGHRAYLLGEVSDSGWWYYFPVIFAVKTPTALLLLLMAVPVGLVLSFRRRPADRLTLTALGLLPLVYFGLSMFSSLNIGLRHLLPVYPFLYVLSALTLVSLLPRRTIFGVVLTAAAALQIWETAGIHPFYLSFFNTVSGGPERGAEYALDSNIDWGQDVKRLKAYVEREKIPLVCTSYFGLAKWEYYKINPGGLPGVYEPGQIESLDCFVAISVTNLYDVYFEKPTYAWLRNRKPDGRIGYSLYLYDLRKKRTPP